MSSVTGAGDDRRAPFQIERRVRIHSDSSNSVAMWLSKLLLLTGPVARTAQIYSATGIEVKKFAEETGGGINSAFRIECDFFALNFGIRAPNGISVCLLQFAAKVEELHTQIVDESLDINKNYLMVFKNSGPRGYFEMAEVGNMPLPPKLLRRGIKDMVRAVGQNSMSSMYFRHMKAPTWIA